MSDRKVAIITCAAADIPPELERKHKITILPVIINFEDKSYKTYSTEKGLSLDEFYVLTENEVPSTAIPSPGLYAETFKTAFEIADSIICIFISNKMSGVYNTAIQVASNLFSDKDISVFHSGASGAGTASLALAAAKLADQGKSKEEIILKIKEWTPHVIYAGIINKLDNLVRTGRLSKTKKFFANILKFKPVLTYQDDEIHILGNIRADDKIILSQMKSFGLKALENIHPDCDTLFINHTRWPETANELADYLKENNPKNIDIVVQETGVINSFYVGKYFLTIGYIGKFDPDWLMKTS